MSALSHHVGLPLAQHAVSDKTNAITQVEAVRRQLVLPGRVCTMDAFLTQRHVAQAIVDGGGDDVMIVKEHQPQLHAAIALVFPMPPPGDPQPSARTVDVGHGRIEQRTMTTSEALVGYSDWPGLAQVCEIGRYVITKNTGQERVAVVYGVTSLRPERVSPGQLLAVVRGHWHIENTSHWVRDVTFDEDRSQVRCGHIPPVMAALRNTAIGVLRWAGHTNIDSAGEPTSMLQDWGCLSRFLQASWPSKKANGRQKFRHFEFASRVNIAAACRQMAAQPAQALALMGIALED